MLFKKSFSNKNLIFFVLIFLFINTPSSFTQNISEPNLNEISKKFNKLLLNADTDAAFELLKAEEQRVNEEGKDELAQINYLYSKYYFFMEDLDQAKIYAKKSLEAGEKSNSNIEKAYGFYTMAFYYYQANMLAVAFSNLNKSLAYLNPDEHPYLAYLINYRLYSIYTNWDGAKETNLYAQKALEYAIKVKNYDALSNAYGAKVSAMKNMYTETQEETYKDSVLHYLNKSANLDHKYPNEVSIRTNAIAQINLADYYFQKFRNKEIPYKVANDSIVKYLAIVENIPSSIDQNFELRASSLGMKAQLALAENDFETAEKYLLTAYNNLKEEKYRPAFYTLYNVTIGLHLLYQSKDDYKNAYQFLGINQAFKDSIFNENKIREVNSLEAKYENNQIKKELKYLENKSSLQKTQNYLLIAVSLLAFSTLIFFLKYYRKKMAQQKAAAKAEVFLEREKQARLSAERKILKLENEKMQKEAMVSNLQIERKNELLEEIREQLSSTYGSGVLQRTLKQEKKIEKSLNETVKEFEDINPVFFQNLKNQSDNKLTSLDLKYCAYFHLGLSTKEISQIFNVEPKSIRMTKYRIKQKLKLPKEKTIESFFEELT